MQTFKPLTKLLVIRALCPSFAAAEGLWNGIKAGAGSAYERGRSLSLDAFATGADLAARGMDRTRRTTEDVSAFIIRGVSIYRVTESGMRIEAILFGTRFWPDEGLNHPAPVGNY